VRVERIAGHDGEQREGCAVPAGCAGVRHDAEWQAVGSKERAHFCAGLIHRNVPAFSGRYLNDYIFVVEVSPLVTGGETVARLAMYRDLLVHVDGSSAGRRRVQFAVTLARRVGARLSGLHVTPPPDVPLKFKPSRIARAASEISLDLASDASTAATLFAEEAKQRLEGACWFEAAGDVVKGLSDRARYADLVILGQYERQAPLEAHPLPIAHSLSLRCGRPVLVVPAGVQPNAIDRVAIAWDGSREVVRAIHDALPLLRLSQSVNIVQIVSPSAENYGTEANQLATHLTNHGIEVGPDVLRGTTLGEHEALGKLIELGHYDLLIMGSYSKPRWLEFLFGGASWSILTSSTIPVLVSH
jgi:nucleotide-binding universal stress UspA family protein